MQNASIDTGGTPAVGAGQTLPRCCPQHTSAQELATHLAAAYPEADDGRVIQELRRALGAARWAGLGPEELSTAELIARSQLEILVGRRSDDARLDPERHARWHTANDTHPDAG